MHKLLVLSAMKTTQQCKRIAMCGYGRADLNRVVRVVVIREVLRIQPYSSLGKDPAGGKSPCKGPI